ncbi:hypothetical protein EHS86_05665 [Erwinia amylovora]|nr:hypothetical protein AD997_17310 [Erwinia amylovora]RWS39293.1 hypothetical protein EHS86_05665 [Erwinia amylovora]GAJ87354.1 hypothetical protein EAM01S_01_02115 [Erwinia amylovora NBRC 12687 = CFBP 1232]
MRTRLSGLNRRRFARRGKLMTASARDRTTPNNRHFAVCKAAPECGLHVICEKPLCFSSAEAKELAD